MTKEKPKITEIMMLAFTRDFEFTSFNSEGCMREHSEEEHERFIIPLTGFTVLDNDKENELVIKVPKEVKPKFKKYKRFTLSITDDPRVTWASDWSDLGCFRMVYKYFQPKVEVKNGKLYVSNKRKKDNVMRDRDLTVPDKVRWF